MLNEQGLREVFEERLSLGKEKHKRYSARICPIEVGGVAGVVLRCLDKVARAISIVSDPSLSQKDESLRDTLLDLGNYADYAVLLMDGNWKVSTTKIEKETLKDKEKKG